MLRGAGVSAGVARGTALVLTCGHRSAAPRRNIAASEVDAERSRFEAALARAASELVALQNEVSLGTNDLVQYVLAADREDESIAPYYQPLHPGVLRLIHSVAEEARGADCELTICGEMAGDPFHAELLLGLGLREFSVAPGEMLEVKNAIRRTRLDEARELARKALELGSVAEIEALLNERRAAAQ